MREMSNAAIPAQPPRSPARLAGRIALHVMSLAAGVAALVAYEHFSVQGSSTASLASLVAAGAFGLAPLRLVLHEIFAVEGRLVHLVHGIGGLSVVGLTLGGAVSGTPVLTHASLAPFAMMGAAQALMHPNQPRNAEQAAALRNFETSLPEVEAFAHGDLSSPANARRAVAVMTDLVSKAETLGETELRADPNFQSAWRDVPARVGLSLGLDAIDRAIGTLAANPATAATVPDLRRKLAAARRTVGE